MSKQKIDIKKLNFEDALSNLENIVEKLSNGKVSLEEMVELYDQGIALKNHCDKKLVGAKMKVEVLMKKESIGLDGK